MINKKKGKKIDFLLIDKCKITPLQHLNTMRSSQEIVENFLQGWIKKYQEKKYDEWMEYCEEQEKEEEKRIEALIAQGKYNCRVCGDKIYESDSWGTYRLCSRMCARDSDRNYRDDRERY